MIYFNNFKCYEVLRHEANVSDTVLEYFFKQCTEKKSKNKNNNIVDNFLTVRDIKKSKHKYENNEKR